MKIAILLVGDAFRYAILAALATIIFAPLASAQTPKTTVPYKIDYDGWITVEAYVNGKGPYDFIIDTGATLSLAFENLARDQKFTLANEPPRRILGLNSQQETDVITIGDIAVGEERLANHVGVVLADWDAPRRTPQGIIGLDFLERYLVVFDRDARTISFYDPQGAPPAALERWRQSELVRRVFVEGLGALYTTRATVNGKKVSFILDLGASGTLINFAALRQILSGVRVNPTGSANTGSRLSDITGDETTARLVLAQTLRIGGMRWVRALLLVYNAEIFNELRIRSQPYGLLGADIMTQRSFAINFNDEKLYIKNERPRKTR